MCHIQNNETDRQARAQSVIIVRQFNKVRRLFPSESFRMAVQHERNVYTQEEMSFPGQSIIPNTGLLLGTKSNNIIAR